MVLQKLCVWPHTDWGQSDIFPCLVFFLILVSFVSCLFSPSDITHLIDCFSFSFRWFTYMGEAKDNPFVPFQITYIETNKTIDKFVPLNPSITPCSKGISVSVKFIYFDCLKYLNHPQQISVNTGSKQLELNWHLSSSIAVVKLAWSFLPPFLVSILG